MIVRTPTKTSQVLQVSKDPAKRRLETIIKVSKSQRKTPILHQPVKRASQTRLQKKSTCYTLQKPIFNSTLIHCTITLRIRSHA